MLPGKAYSPEEVLRIVRRRMWLLLIPVAVITAATAVVVRRMPNYYAAETVILVEPQRVPESYVRPVITTRLGDRLRTINPMIQSRTRLERIIQDLDLYPDERRVMAMEDVVAMMRNSIGVDTLRDDAFSVRYVGREPRKVMDVTNRLATLYIDESVNDRQRQAEGTDEFLESQLQEKKQRLIEADNKLRIYREQHALELPSQVESNLQQVRAAQTQAQSDAEIISKLQDRRAEAERTLAALDAAPAAALGDLPGAKGGGTAQQLAQAQADLAGLQARYKSDHPDVQAAARRVSDLTQALQRESAAAASSRPALSPLEAARRQRQGELQAGLADIDAQIGKARTDEQRQRQIAEDAQKRIDSLPLRESEMTELTRDYGTLDQGYKDLLAKKEEATMATNLERQQIGEQFRLLDPAQLPERPISPNRTQLTSIAAGGGLIVGLVLAALLEYRDRSFRIDQDVAMVLQVPVLASVPLMRSENEERRQLITRVLIDLTCGGVVTGCLAVVVYTLVR